MMNTEEYLKKSLKQLDGDIINHWYILALEHEVPMNRPMARTVYDKPYVLYRDDKNIIKVHLDQCIHRGAPLSKGHCEKGGIRCPYHGWLFNGEGEVIEIPSENEDKKLSARKWKLPEVPVVLQDGCVWIWVGELSKKTQNPPWRFPNADEKNWIKYFMITDFDNEVTHLVQNFMDVPHTVYVHDKWFRKKRLIKVRITIEVKEGTVKVTYHQNDDSIGFMKKILNPGNEPMVHTDEFIFPNITRVDYSFGKRSFIISSQCTPVTRFKTRVYTWIAYDIGFFSRILKGFFQFYTRQVINQDVDIMKKHGDVLRVLGENIYHSTGADDLHLAIQKMRDMGAEDRARPADMNFTRERDFWI
jgi:phenylpropionate dioxygenase-like ring-hydroxylating dioxygenase large terminal subunit